MESNAAPLTRRGISGRYFTLGFIAILGAVLAFGIPVVLRFIAIQDQLQQVRQAWPPLAEELESEYRIIDDRIAIRFPEVASEASEEPTESWLKQWRDARRRFAATTDHELQVSVATELEKLRSSEASKLAGADPARQTNAMNGPAAENYTQAARRLGEVESNRLGRLTCLVLRLSKTPTLVSP